MEAESQLHQKKVDFLCVGCQKGGTTTLRAYLNAHPQIDMPSNEVHFFDDELQDWGNPDYTLYHHYFKSLNTFENTHEDLHGLDYSDLQRGEVTPYYIYWAPCADRIYRYNSQIKIIIVLRNPMARAYSQWQMEISKRREHISFSECIRIERQRLQEYPPFYQHRVYSYIDRGRYYTQIKRFLEFFDIRQILAIKSEDFFFSPLSTIAKISDFLAVSPYQGTELMPLRQNLYQERLKLDDWQYMYDCLASEIESLENLLGWDCNSWKKPWMETA